MIGVGLGIGVNRAKVSGGGSSFDAGYQTILNLATTAGYTLPSSANQIKQNALYVALKNAGILAKLDILAIFINDGSSQFGLIDWIRTVNTNTLVTYTAVASPTWSATQGFTGNGSSSYIDTNFNPFTQGVNYQLNNASRYYFHFAGSNITADGIASSATRSQIRINNNTTQQNINSAAGTGTNFLYSADKAIKSIHRTSSSSISLIDEKSTPATRSQTSDSVSSDNQLILKRSTSTFSNNTCWGYAMGASLVAENNTFVDALNAYLS